MRVDLLMSSRVSTYSFVFTTRRYASAIYAVVVCPSVRSSVLPSQADTVPKRLNIVSRKQSHTQHRDCSFLKPEISARLQRSHPITGVKYNKRGVG